MTVDWTALYAQASTQEGHFTTRQAAAAGYSRPLLDHHVKSGRFVRVHRGIYRLRDFPLGEHEDDVVAWLWSGQQGVLSHDTALAAHGLSDALPDRIHLTVPDAWRTRRLKVPPIVVLHHGDVPMDARSWAGPVPVTTPLRTVMDCAQDHVSAELVAQAVGEGLRRGLFTPEALQAAGLDP